MSEKDSINNSHTLASPLAAPPDPAAHVKYIRHYDLFALQYRDRQDQTQDLKELKRIKNRIASRKCRERKQLKILNLQNRIKELIIENEILKSRLEQIL